MDGKFLKPYDPKETEPRIYSLWEKSGYFSPDKCIEDGITKKDAKSFTIIMPPTNANGSLHAGHGLVMTVEDIITRYKRMCGYKTLWLPGLDHAGFETQVVYEKKLEKEGKSRFDFERDTLYKNILDFTLENSKNIKSQIRATGASCDWSREKFTLDQDIIKIVYQTFKRLYDDKLLYRGKRIISWCPKHQTSFADIEIKDEEKTEPYYYYLKYGPFTISTSRPETKFGDKYVVMHPNDKRYADFKHGQKIDLEWINGPITTTVIKDDVIDMEFGTGVMTITPWHDVVDFGIAERHGLEKEQIIDEKGKLLPIAGEFAGQHITKARPLIIEKLKNKGLVVKTEENYKHIVHTCYKCGTTIEPQIQNQWFVKTRSLADKALERIRKDVKYIPEHYKKITEHWLENLIDWNISRQIVWGIPIPAKICDSCEEGFVDLDNKITKCAKCGGHVRQDKDTFDTWFSSSQWPFVTLGYPDKKDFETYYPTNVMETAGDIFHWVARMIMLGLYVTGKLPFDTVYMHGMVLDAKGQKMSKSKGNVINPLDFMNKYGTDAFRFGLIIGNTPGTSLALSEDKISAYKKFANKLWNVTRFILSTAEGLGPKGELQPDVKPVIFDENFNTWSTADAVLIKELDDLLKDITDDMDNFRYYLAGEKLYHYAWHTLADLILEDSKKVISSGNLDEVYSRKQTLLHIWSKVIKALHPFMPYVTEEIWFYLPIPNKKLLLVEKWPK